MTQVYISGGGAFLQQEEPLKWEPASHARIGKEAGTQIERIEAKCQQMSLAWYKGPAHECISYLITT